MIASIFIILTAVFLAYANGANDNFKGAATLFGSGAASYRKALWWAAIATFAGSLAAAFISVRLAAAFSGKGLVAQQIANGPRFLLSVGLGAALAVFIATLIGMPVSTTHSLTGALIGAGLIAAGSQINLNLLANKFFAPLLISPVVSSLLTFIVYPCFKFLRMRLGIERQMCLCIADRPQGVCINADGTAVLKSTGVSLSVDQLKNCQAYYQGKIIGFDSQVALDKLHYLSSAAVCFARGLNDTPKIAALLPVIGAFSLKGGIFLLSAAIAAGGLLNARKVALTMSRRITRINHGQGFSANLVTTILVIFASRWGLPVSTTHVSCGSLFGIGMMNKEANITVIRQIILAWVLTLPLAGILSALCFLALRFLG